MIARIFDFLAGRDAPVAEESEDELSLAVAALLVEAAQMDETFDDAERSAIERVLAAKFKLDAAALNELVDAAEREVKRSAHYYPFTSKINQGLDAEAKIRIVEMLWQVAYADGVLDAQEDRLLRQVAGLIHVTDRERGLARQRALEKLAAGQNSSGKAGLA